MPDIGPFDAAAAREKLARRRAAPDPDRSAGCLRPRRRRAANRCPARRSHFSPTASRRMATRPLSGAPRAQIAASVRLGRARPARMVGLTAGRKRRSTASRSRPFARRRPGAARNSLAGAFDDKGRRIADATLTFGPGEATATGDDGGAVRTAQRLRIDRTGRRAAGRRGPCPRRKFQAPPRRPDLAGGGRPGAAIAFAALLHPPRAAAFRRSGRTVRARISPRRSRNFSTRSRR